MARRLGCDNEEDDTRSKTYIRYTPSKHRLIYYEPYASQYTYGCTNRNAKLDTKFDEIYAKHGDNSIYI